MEPVLFSRKKISKQNLKESQTTSNNLKQSQKITNNLKQSQTISKNLKKKLKKSQNISKYLKICLMLFFKRCFCETGFFIAYFSGPQKISKNLKSQKKSKSFRFAGKRRKKTIKNKIRPNKLMQTYKNLGPSLRFLPCFLKQ